MKAKTIRQDNKEFGFGTFINSKDSRLVNKDGTANINRIGVPATDWLNLYHRLITMSWWKFGLLVLTFFLIINFLFAIAYFVVGVEHLAGIYGENMHDSRHPRSDRANYQQQTNLNTERVTNKN